MVSAPPINTWPIASSPLNANFTRPTHLVKIDLLFFKLILKALINISMASYLGVEVGEEIISKLVMKFPVSGNDTRVVYESLLALAHKNVTLDLGSIDLHGGLFMGLTTKVLAWLLTNQVWRELGVL